jgi:hypothetical protein
MFASRVLGLVCFAALAGCAVNPSTGRHQLVVLPTLQMAHAKAGFSLASAGQDFAFSSPCTGPRRGVSPAIVARLPCPSAAQVASFTQQVERIGNELATEARLFSPALFTEIKAFHIGVARDMSAGTVSSAGGTIVLAADLAALNPTDDVVAFLIAREMGHVIARHGQEDSGARMVFSIISIAVPGVFLAKLAGSLLGSQVLTTTWADAQRREADELALTLLARCNRSLGSIAFNMKAGLRFDLLPTGDWGTDFRQSAKRVEMIDLQHPTVAPAESIVVLGNPVVALKLPMVGVEGPVVAQVNVTNYRLQASRAE